MSSFHAAHFQPYSNAAHIVADSERTDLRG
jgi:hypothetical protein